MEIEKTELQNKIISYEQLICANEDESSKLDSMDETLLGIRKEKEKLENELKSASSQIEKLAEKVYDLGKSQANYSSLIKSKDEQIDLLKSIIHDLTMKISSYIPFKV